MSIDIRVADGSMTFADLPNTQPLTAPDPRGGTDAIDLMSLDYDELATWAGQLASLSERSRSTGDSLSSIDTSVDWKGGGADAFKRAMKQTSPALETLAQSYESAARAVNTFADAVAGYQTQFSSDAASIRELTYQLTGFKPSDESWRPAAYTPTGTPHLTQERNPFAYGVAMGELSVAKTHGYGVLSEFTADRQTLISQLQSAEQSAPKAPPWWLAQMDPLLVDVAHLKGMTKRELAEARGLAAAEAAYERDPSAANKRRLQIALAATSAIAALAIRDGDRAIGTRLMDDEAGSLQHLSSLEAGTLRSGRQVATVQADKDQITEDLRHGDVAAAEKEELAMLTATENQGTDPRTVKANATAYDQAHDQAKGIAAELHPSGGSGGLSGDQSTKIGEMLKEANSLRGLPYIYGGGHSGWGPQSGYDCSGFVSKVLHSAGYLSEPCTTQTLPGQPGILNGPGQHVTIYDCTDAGMNDHTIINIDGHWFESGGFHGSWGGGGGVEAIGKPSASYLAEFNLQLHPAGL